MLKVFSVTRENDSHSETAVVMDKSDLSVDDNALIRVCSTIWPGTLDEDYGYFALPVDTSSVFVANNIQQEAEDCWVWTVKFVAETEETETPEAHFCIHEGVLERCEVYGSSIGSYGSVFGRLC